MNMTFKDQIRQGIPTELPSARPLDPNVSHAPNRKRILTEKERKLAIRNALRYFPAGHHSVLGKEFAEEMDKYGRIYMYRFRPDYEMYARPISEYPAKCDQAAAIMLMIQNNLDPAVAQHPEELITYGGNGAVFSNWAQYLLTMKYLSEMTDEQTLVMYSGHPMGLFPSHKDAPRVVVTNGMMIPNYSKPDDWEKFNALGVTQYGQMTAGSYMYIGPQGIVHGTTITILNASRKYRQQAEASAVATPPLERGGVRLRRTEGSKYSSDSSLMNKPKLKYFRKQLRENLTPAEAKLWSYLQGSQLDGRKFRRQHSVDNYVLDFYCPEEKLAVELDGEVHANVLSADYDQERTEFMNSFGIKVVRFENEMVFHQPEVVLNGIKGEFGWHIDHPTPSGHPSFPGGESATRKAGSGILFVTAGLGGMSGAQPKAGNIAGAVTICAEVNKVAAEKRYSQGWVDELVYDVDACIDLALEWKAKGEPRSIAFVGNVVDLWERLAEREVTVELGSDQTSLHNPWAGGYYPAGLSYEESNELMAKDPEAFKVEVQKTLVRHVNAVNKLTATGMYFFDYGNAFLLESGRAGADIFADGGKEEGLFKYPSYVQDIMGPMCFDYGFGPFRWVCTSGKTEDLQMTDTIAGQVIEEMLLSAPSEIRGQLQDNLLWVQEAQENKLVVGSQARILYADAEGRTKVAAAFNQAIKEGKIGPVVLGRDHHDVSGTDSPYRETSNIYDGSQFTADMAVQNFVGDGFRGATWISLHNGGGVGWGEVMNGGFGMLLDGSEEADRRLRMMLHWDVNNGIARRSWARNDEAVFAIKRAMEDEPRLKVTLPNFVNDDLLEDL